MRLCEILKQYRWAKRIDGRELAQELGFSASTLSRIEHGETPSGANLAKILLWLMEERDAKH